jgi:3-deoxy-D-manno-octulosonate 8-phosphate phosphatase KdsC-like HAD superfamily phosphatase
MPTIDQFQHNKLLVFGVDGVKTDGRTWQIAYGIQGLELVRSMGLKFTVPTSAADLRRAVSCATIRSGGDGAVLEVCNQLIGARAPLKSKRENLRW